MAFLVPAVLAGAAAVAAPLAIHLLNRTQVKVVRWAAIRFLQESLRKNQRRLQIEDLLLLLLRCLFIVLLALAFARLVLHPGAAEETLGSGPMVAVVIVDQSASMGQSNGFRTAFDEAKSAAGKFLGGLAGGSQAALFLVGEQINQVVPRPTANLAVVRRALEVAEPTDGRADLTAAVRLAMETLEPFAGSRREILVFTDNQAAAWPESERIRSLREGAPDVKVTVIQAGASAEGENLAITALRPETGVPAAGRQTGFLVDVANFGPTPAAGARVTLALDDGPPVDETMLETIEPGGTRTVRLTARFSHPGFHTVRAALPTDRMPVDNTRTTAVEVVDTLRAAVVEGGSGVRDRRDAFFLANALAPVAPARRAEYFLQVEAAPPSWLEATDLSRLDLIFLADVPKLSAPAAKALGTYVEQGGALVVFPGARTDVSFFNTDPVLSALLPARLGARKTSPEALAWQGAGFTHPVTALWNDASNGSLAGVRATSWFPLTPVDGATPLVQFADGTPAAIEVTRGRGRVVLFATAPTTEGNNLPIHPQFVPLIQRLLGHLSPRTDFASLVLAPGASFQGEVSTDLARREVSILTPGSGDRPRPAGRVEADGQRAVVRYHDTARAGGYRFLVTGREAPVSAFAVQMDPRESDLRTLAAEEVAAIQGGETRAEIAASSSPSGPVRRELWVYFLLAAGVVFFTEMALAHRFSVSR